MSGTAGMAVGALNSVQMAFVTCPARFSFYIGDIGAGKTFAEATRALQRSD